MKRFDKRQRQNWLQRKFAKHKRLASAFDEFGIIWLSVSSVSVAFVASLLSTLPGTPFWLTALLILVYAPYFAYQAQKWSEFRITRKFQEKIDALNRRIDELEDR